MKKVKVEIHITDLLAAEEAKMRQAVGTVSINIRKII